MAANDIIWSFLSLLFIGLAYFATIIFVASLLWKVIDYLRTPMTLSRPLKPALRREAGFLLRALGDLTVFPNLFKTDKWLWAGTWVFHVALAAILFRHVRYFTYPVPKLVLSMETTALIFGCVFGVATLFLFWRRLSLHRVLSISKLPDYLALVLLGLIAGSGLMVSYWLNVNIVEVKSFILGLMTLHPVELPHHSLFLLHMVFVLALMIYSPLSQWLHADGIIVDAARKDG